MLTIKKRDLDKKVMRAYLKNLSNQLFKKVDFLMPIRESVINSILAGAKEITISLIPDENDSNNLINKPCKEIIIEDDGMGFIKECRDSFNTIAKSNKEECKGLGRLSFFRVFETIKVDSNFIENDIYKKCSFIFNEHFKKILEKDLKNSDLKKNKTIVHFKNLSTKFKADKNNKADCEFIFKNLLNDILPQLLFKECQKIIIKDNVDSKSFSLKIEDNQWTEAENKIYYDDFKTDGLIIKYFLTDTLKEDYFYFLSKKRAVKKVFSNENIKIDLNNKRIIVLVEGKILDDTPSADWKDFDIENDIYNKIKYNTKKEITNLLEKLSNTNFLINFFQEAIENRPDLKKTIIKLSENEKYLALEGVEAIIDKADDSIKKTIRDFEKNATIKEEDVKDLEENGLTRLTIGRFSKLQEAYKICNNKDFDEKNIQNLLCKELWLLDSRWQYADYISSDDSICKIFNLTNDEKNLDSIELLQKHNIDLSTIDNNLKDSTFKDEFKKRPDIAIFNNDSVVIIELKKAGVKLSQHTEKLKYYASLISSLHKDYKRFYCYLIGNEIDVIADYNLTIDKRGYFDTKDLKIRKKQTDGSIEEENLNSKMYYEICEYNKFLKDCYFQHLPFFEQIKRRIVELDTFLPEKYRKK